MLYKKLGETGIKISRLGFGCLDLGEEQKNVDKLLNFALDYGINFFDTARAYGCSEIMIGKAISDRRKEYYLASKTGERDYKKAKKEIEISLKNLKTDYIDLYQLHNVATQEDWNQVMARKGALKALIEAKEAGKINYIGITIHRSLNNMYKAINSDIFSTIMLYYNPLDEENVGQEILALAGKSKIGVIGMKALSGGSLVIPAKVKEEKAYKKDLLVEGCLRYVLNEPNIDVVLVGMKDMQELKENLATEKMPALSDKEKEDLIKMIGNLNQSYKYKQRCLQCSYCQPCPQGIDIADVFRSVFIWENYPEAVKNEAYKVVANIKVNPTKCIQCGSCVKRCPAGIDIPARLKELLTKFEIIKQRKKEEEKC